ncbi:MAG: NAD(+)/NADH kinase [Candidatus Geothermincolia bacterium]
MDEHMRVIGLMPNIHKEHVREVARDLAAWLLERGKEVRVLAEDAAGMPEGVRSASRDDFTDDMDLICSLGGDGTVLRAVEAAYPRSTPLVGVNLGKMGFLTAFGSADMYASLQGIFSGDYIIQERMMVECRVLGKHEVTFYALNEVVVGREMLERILRMDIYLEGEFFNSYSGDGMIFSTPTGSTAYSLSAGGPILEPNLQCLLMTPICSHSLMARSIAIHPQDHIEVRFGAQKAAPALSIDGRTELALEPGQFLQLTGAAKPLRLVKLPGYSFYGLLRRKFEFPED